ncbi:hypothetical protein DPEC_G00280160 [Dallia pectoralis]|uniref:Uncharacterized protein n=1 Tax=Dallia pectoralis TaxID=75939 RepID=A0ACC2FML4_DALPE|nr:hypothetical protein DPEC_G00280160 [Dallia pectoralis]
MKMDIYRIRQADRLNTHTHTNTHVLRLRGWGVRINRKKGVWPLDNRALTVSEQRRTLLRSLGVPADSAPRDYYKSYPMVDYTRQQSSPPTFQPIAFHKDKPFLPPPDIHAPLAITITAGQLPKPKISKTNTHPLTSSSAFKAWDPRSLHEDGEPQSLKDEHSRELKAS